MVAALASWLDARAHHGKWLLRIEDVDTARCVPGADQIITQQLSACGMHPDEPPVYQSQRGELYRQALEQLVAQGRAYPCSCTRQSITQALAAAGHPHERHGEVVYPGTCRLGLKGQKARAWRFKSTNLASNVPLAQVKYTSTATNSISSELTTSEDLHWFDRRWGPQAQNVGQQVGDFVLKRADGLWAYQLAVVVDDAAQGITHVVRGEDLVDNTARQILLQRALGVPQPAYLHTPLVRGINGEKLSKQNGATALDVSKPVVVLAQAGRVLGLPEFPDAHSPADWLEQAIPSWASTRHTI